MTLSPAIDQDKYCLLYIMRFEAMIRLALLHNKTAISGKPDFIK